ncbi:MAG TPA: hypothetical protein VFB59_04145 [Candidatus Saccharimonadales bacterium]|nr:hypothetical protein [Candidatus Saccharimonadales bacterium]
MKQLIAKIKPASGFSQFLRVGLNVLFPLIIFVLVRIEFVQLAFVLILLSKWRMFVVRPRFWLANIRANSVDIIVSISILLFMVNSASPTIQLLWAAGYAIWLAGIKPMSSTFMVSLQATFGLLFGLSAIFIGLGDSPLYVLVLLSGLICYLAARHFFDSFDEPFAKLLSFAWAYFGAALTLVLGHWLLFYGNGIIAQPTLLLAALGYCLAALYYLDHYDKLSKLVRIEIVTITAVIVVAIVGSLTVNITGTVQELLR